jgi:hypothetical protein
MKNTPTTKNTKLVFSLRISVSGGEILHWSALVLPPVEVAWN